MKLWRDRQTMYPNHLDEVDAFDCLLVALAIVGGLLVAWLG